MPGFLHKLVDWRDFEQFVASLYETHDQVIVEHNITENGKSGAPRQTDVRVTATQAFHKIVILVECKRWKEKVSRDRIDVLAASVEDLNANKGVIFTTSGYEPRAQAYAKHKGIDAYVVRDLTDEEWGLPGREVRLWLRMCGSTITNIALPDLQMIPLVEDPPTNLPLDLTISRDGALDPDLHLHSVKTGERGPHLLSRMLDFQSVLQEHVNAGAPRDKEDMALTVSTPVRVNFSKAEFRQLRLAPGAVALDIVEFQLRTRITQTLLRFDRGAGLDVVLAVEDLFGTQRSLVTRKAPDETLALGPLRDLTRDPPSDEVLKKNDSVLLVFLEPWVTLDFQPTDKQGETSLIEFDSDAIQRASKGSKP